VATAFDDEYKENLKSNIADMVNSGSRWEAQSLPRCSEGIRRRHSLDPPRHRRHAWMEDSKPWIAKGRRESRCAVWWICEGVECVKISHGVGK